MYELSRLADKRRAHMGLEWRTLLLLLAVSAPYIAHAGLLPVKGPSTTAVPVQPYDGFFLKQLLNARGAESGDVTQLSSLGYDISKILQVGSSAWLLAGTDSVLTTASARLSTHATSAGTVGALQQLISDFRVAGFKAEPNYIVKAIATPNDPLYSSIGTTMRQISAEAAWNIFKGSSDQITVCVIDTGIQSNHPDLLNTAAVYDAINNNMKTAPFDDNGHGTHCAGTIGAVGNNNVGIAGVSWNVRLLGCKFLSASGSGTTANAIKCITWCRNQGARITSNSWGSSTSPPEALVDEVRVSQNAGHIFIAAAGNSNMNIDATPSSPASINLPGVITVGAVDSSDNKASFSNYGSNTVHLFAPGVGIYSTYITSTYASLSGTSMATPHVAGAVALLWSYKPTATAAEIKDALLQGVDVVAGAAASRSRGRLNLFKSLLLLTASSRAVVISTSVGTGPWLLTGNAASPFISAGAQWIWGSANALNSAPTNVGYVFEKSFAVAIQRVATLLAVADNQCTVTLNGVRAGVIIDGWGSVSTPSISLTLRAGVNLLRLHCINIPTGDPTIMSPNPAGLIAVLRDSTGAALVFTDNSWTSRQVPVVVVISTNVLTAPWRMSANAATPFTSAGAQWIWGVTGALTDAPIGVTYVFEKLYTATAATPVRLIAVADNQCDVFLNGAYMSSIIGGWDQAPVPIFSFNLIAGLNVLTLSCFNYPGGDPTRPGPNPAGLILVLRNSQDSVLVRTDSSWTLSQVPAAVVISSDVGTSPWFLSGNMASPFVNAGAQWIWAGNANALIDAPTGVTYFFEKFYTATAATPVTLLAVADNQCNVFLNGAPVGIIIGGWGQASVASLSFTLVTGLNVLSLRCFNYPWDDFTSTGPNPAGLIAVLLDSARRTILYTDSTWSVTIGPAALVIAGNVGTEPWLLSGDAASPFIRAGALWIWVTATARFDALANLGYAFEKSYTSDRQISATLQAVADNQCNVFLNNVFAGTINDGWGQASVPSLALNLSAGVNTLRLTCINVPFDDPSLLSPNPAGLIALLRDTSGSVLLRTDGTWFVNTVDSVCRVRTCGASQQCQWYTGRCAAITSRSQAFAQSVKAVPSG